MTTQRCMANFKLSLVVKEFLESVKIWHSYCPKFGGFLFWDVLPPQQQLLLLLILLLQRPSPQLTMATSTNNSPVFLVSSRCHGLILPVCWVYQRVLLHIQYLLYKCTKILRGVRGYCRDAEGVEAAPNGQRREIEGLGSERGRPLSSGSGV